MMADDTLSRRAFLTGGVTATGGAAVAMSAASYGRVVGANDRVGIGFIGYGLIGKRHVIDFQEQKDVNMIGVAEAHRGRLDEAIALIGAPARGYVDFRQLFENRQVDAVVISTPDHWHALMAMMACAAGKDVYVEKPLTLFVEEGRWMLDVARRTGRVVQVGTQQRSGKHYQRARELVRTGHLGKISSVRMQAARNVMPGFGSPADCAPPPELDWNMWLGPAPWRAYNPNRAIYHFRWFWDYSGGQMTNLGQHCLDIVDWFLGVEDLAWVCSGGGRFQLMDNGETPDTQDAIFQFHDWTATWSHRETSRGRRIDVPLEFFGTHGSLGISRGGFHVAPDAEIPPANVIPQFTGAHPVGGPRRVAVATGSKYKTEAIADDSGDSRAQLKDHVRNFLDCIKSRETPISDLASAHRTATLCHLANIAQRLGRTIRWDSTSQAVVGDREASERLVRPYRAPWDAELKSLGVG